MCGIAGVVQNSPDTPRPQFDLVHRGPDGESIQVVGSRHWSGHLYHSRLSINDLTDAGQEPMTSQCGSGVTLAFNGEIYNYLELRRESEAKGHTFQSDMDGEVILHLYEDSGVEAFRRLNGIFAISLLDSDGTLVLTRDQVGVKPLFYRELQGGVAFASEPGNLAHRFGNTNWDVRALAAFLTFLWVPAPWTAFKEVRSLRPGEVLTWRPRNRGATVTTGPHAFRFPPELEPPKSPAHAGAEVGTLLDRSVRRQLLADVPIGVMASGGTDSTLIWDACRDEVKVGYTIQGTSGVEGLDADGHAADRYASTHHLRHRLLEPNENALNDYPTTGDLLADPAFMLTRTISAAARVDKIPVLLSGQGADEVLGGYRRHTAAAIIEKAPAYLTKFASALMRHSSHPIMAEYSRRLHAAAASVAPFDKYSELYRYADTATRARVLDLDESEVDDAIVFEEHRRLWDSLPSNWTLTKKALTLDLSVYLPGLGLAYVDRAGMAHGVEVRVPWLDRDLVAWSLAQSPQSFVSLRHRKLPARWLSQTRLPRYIWDRPKVGFAVATEQLGEQGVSRQHQRHATYINRCGEMLSAFGYDNSGF